MMMPAKKESRFLSGKELSMNEDHRMIVASEAGIAIQSSIEIRDAVGACFGAEGLILTEQELAPLFFNLRTGLLGELFQTFTNYGKRLALVLTDPNAYGERFRELIYEHRTHKLIRFFASVEDAQAWLVAEETVA
jgi:Domain of unknown function (DUF4180)